MAAAPAVQPTIHHLLIEKSCSRRRLLWRIASRFPIQNVAFELALKVTNHGNVAFPGGTLSRLRINAGPAGVLIHSFPGVYAIGPLNPGEAKTLSIGGVSSVLSGAIWIECDLAPGTVGDSIRTYQRDAFTREVSEFGGRFNGWGDAWFIQPHLEHQQARTNWLLVLIALLTLLQGVFGLDKIVAAFLRALGSFLVWLGHLFVH